jgi:hypothetical protein
VCSRLPKHHELSQHQQQSYHLYSQDQKSNAAAVSYTIAEGVSLVVEGNKPKDGDSATLAKLTYEF